MQEQDFALIDISEFQRLLGQKGFELVEQENADRRRKGTLAWCIRQEAVTRVRVPPNTTSLSRIAPHH